MPSPIIILEDDDDDHAFIQEAYQNLQIKNELKLFTRAEEVFDYLLTTKDQPFLIISEIQLRGMDGTELRRRILENEHLKNKSIPFVFYTTHCDKKDVEQAYELQVQGYFVKKFSIPDLTRMLQKLVDYWGECKHPNNLQQ